MFTTKSYLRCWYDKVNSGLFFDKIKEGTVIDYKIVSSDFSFFLL